MGEKSREKKERREGGFIAEKEVAGQNAVPIFWWIIFAGTILILFTPFIVSSKYFFPFVGPKSIYFLALSEIIFVAWLILMIFAPKYRPRFNVLTLAIILFLIISILSSVFGVDLSRSFWSKYERMSGLLMQFHLCGFFLVISSVFRKKEDWLKILGISVLAAVLMSFLSFYPKAMGEISSMTRGGATLGNSSFLGTYLLFNLFFAIYLFFSSEKFTKIFSFLGIFIIGIALVLSTARAALLSALVGLVLLFLLWLVFKHAGRVRLLGIFLSAVLFVSAIASVFLIARPGNFLHKAVSDNFIGETFGGRFVVWEGAWKSFLEKPWLGWGLENFEISFTKNYNPCMGTDKCGSDVWYDRAHNIIFDTLANTGILGFLSYLGIFVSAFLILWRQFSRQNITFWAAGILSVVLISYFVQNLTVFDMINSYAMFFLVLGLIGNIAANQDESSGQKRIPSMPAAAVILILFVFSFSNFVLKPLEADSYIIKSLGFPLGSQQRLDSYQKTLAISPIGKYQIRDFFDQSTLELIRGMTDSSNISAEGVKKELDFNIEEMKKTLKESPLDFRAYLKLGQTYNLYTVTLNISKLPQSEEVLQKAVELSPKNQQGYWALAQTEIYLGKLDKALSLAEKALDLEPRFKTSNLIVIQIAKMTGNQALAEEKANKALEINPAWESEINGILGK